MSFALFFEVCSELQTYIRCTYSNKFSFHVTRRCGAWCSHEVSCHSGTIALSSLSPHHNQIHVIKTTEASNVRWDSPVRRGCTPSGHIGRTGSGKIIIGMRITVKLLHDWSQALLEYIRIILVTLGMYTTPTLARWYSYSQEGVQVYAGS